MPEENNHQLLLRNILVALDTSAHSRAALEAAAILASLLEANIRGVFVQEEHWTRLSRLPSLTAIHELTGKAYALQQDTLEKEIKNVKQRLQRQLKQISSRREITHSLETVQGKAEEEILKAAQEADLITIGWRGRSYPSTKKPGATARGIIRNADKPVRVLGKNVRLGKRISVFYDTGTEAQKGLKLGLILAEHNDSELSVLLSPPQDEKATGERNKEIEKMVDRAAVPVEVTQLRRPDIYSLLYLLNRRRPGLVVMPNDHPFLQGQSLDTMLARLNSPLLLMQ